MQLEKGKEHMVTEIKEQVQIFLKKDPTSNNEILETNINGNVFKIDFVSEEQNYLRNFFNACLKKYNSKPFEFKFERGTEVQNDIIIKVSEDYIVELNKELEKANGVIQRQQSFENDQEPDIESDE